MSRDPFAEEQQSHVPVRLVWEPLKPSHLYAGESPDADGFIFALLSLGWMLLHWALLQAIGNSGIGSSAGFSVFAFFYVVLVVIGLPVATYWRRTVWEDAQISPVLTVPSSFTLGEAFTIDVDAPVGTVFSVQLVATMSRTVNYDGDDSISSNRTYQALLDANPRERNGDPRPYTGRMPVAGQHWDGAWFIVVTMASHRRNYERVFPLCRCQTLIRAEGRSLQRQNGQLFPLGDHVAGSNVMERIPFAEEQQPHDALRLVWEPLPFLDSYSGKPTTVAERRIVAACAIGWLALHSSLFYLTNSWTRDHLDPNSIWAAVFIWSLMLYVFVVVIGVPMAIVSRRWDWEKEQISPILTVPPSLTLGEAITIDVDAGEGWVRSVELVASVASLSGRYSDEGEYMSTKQTYRRPLDVIPSFYRTSDGPPRYTARMPEADRMPAVSPGWHEAWFIVVTMANPRRNYERVFRLDERVAIGRH